MLAHLGNTAITLVLFFLLLFVYTKLAGPIPFSVNSVTTTKSDSFQVTGEGRVEVKPDLAVVSAGVTSTGPTVQAAQDGLNKNINRVSDSIKALGVKPEDIQTTNYNVNPQYDFSSGTQRVNGYQASSNLSIKIRNLDNANAVIDAATKNGATQVGGLSFEISDKTQAENQAREKAVADAKAKAESAAKIAGFRLGKLLNYSEGFSGVTPPMPLRTLSVDMKEQAATQVEPGSNQIIVTVTLSYEVQ